MFIFTINITVQYYYYNFYELFNTSVFLIQ